MRIYLLSCLLLLISVPAFSQLVEYRVPLDQTFAGYPASQDTHLVTLDSLNNSAGLIVWLGGTNSDPEDYQFLREHAANNGFKVISLAYPNSVAAASLRNDPDSLAFDHYRQEICFGTPVSPDVSVDSLNSIRNRLRYLIVHLDFIFPGEGWDNYYAQPSALEWYNISFAGHSQGAGHAAYIAKNREVSCVHMYAGPNDYSDTLSQPAHWLSQPGQTSVGKHYVYLSPQDEVVPFWKQYANVGALGMLQFDDSTLVDNIPPPFNNSHVLITNQPPGFVLLYHNVPVRNTSINQSVWTTMQNCSELVAVDAQRDWVPSIFPNPFRDELRIRLNSLLADDARLEVIDLSGKIVEVRALPRKMEYRIDTRNWPTGMLLYRISSGDRVTSGKLLHLWD